MRRALKRAAASRPSGEWNDDDYDVQADGVAVGRMMKAAASPVGLPWLWTILVIEHREDSLATHGYEATREAGMAALAKSLGDGSDGLPCEKPRHESGSGRQRSHILIR
jgi:hypothetical protein